MYSGALLSQMVVRREIHREYLAIATGLLPESGVIDAPIARKEGSTIERCVDFEHGERAVTHFWRVDYKDGYSLVRLKLETGRTHQIRVHMRHIGHPLAGDFLYCGDFPEAQKKMERQALHSHCLKFLHPITGEAMEFHSPLPHEMEWILDSYL
jgi:23S rRNA pseudouridine1911/1915/1917 synthase